LLREMLGGFYIFNFLNRGGGLIQIKNLSRP